MNQKLPTIDVVKSSKESNADALALFAFKASAPETHEKQPKKGAGPGWHAPEFVGKKDKDISALIEKLQVSKHFRGGKHESSVMHFVATRGLAHTILVGLGIKKRWDAEMARQAGATLLLAQRKAHIPAVLVETETLPSSNEDAYFLQAFCEGYILAGYKYTDLKSHPEPQLPAPKLVLAGLSKAQEKVVQKATALCESVCFSRSLGDRPGNHLTPTMFAEIVQARAKEKKLKCTVFDRARLEKEKMGLFIGVAQGSSEDPRLIILEYQGGKKDDKPIALIGKGITFDSGGISIKPSAKMEEMKFDMMGAAAVAGILTALPDLGIKQNVIGYIAAAENMPGGRAQKPGDVRFSTTGKSVEITNTDAEGRLVLADTIEYAQRSKPQAMVDFATLTGAVVVALGSCVTGIMGTEPKLISRIKEAAEVTGERVWELPLYEEYEEDMRSAVADIKNASENREAGSQKGGIFLKHFVDKSIPWVHCDIAGSGMTRGDLNYAPRKFGPGVMVRLVCHMLENWKKL